MLEAGAVDVLQADLTRCGGATGFLRVAALCDAANGPLSAPRAPSPRGVRRAPRAPHRVLPQPRPARAHAVRRLADPCRRDPRARLLAPRHGTRIQGRRCRALRGVAMTARPLARAPTHDGRTRAIDRADVDAPGLARGLRSKIRGEVHFDDGS